MRKKLQNRMPLDVRSVPGLRASVIVPLYQADGNEYLILTKRTLSVKAHPGEISFPGGMQELTDIDSRTTALRECCEEIGVEREHVEILGRLDDEKTLTGFVITPYAGIIPFPYPFQLSEREVSYLIHLPLRFLIDTAPTLEPMEYKGQVKDIYTFYYNGERIWGATCRILLKLKKIVIE